MSSTVGNRAFGMMIVFLRIVLRMRIALVFVRATSSSAPTGS